MLLLLLHDNGGAPVVVYDWIAFTDETLSAAACAEETLTPIASFTSEALEPR